MPTQHGSYTNYKSRTNLSATPTISVIQHCEPGHRPKPAAPYPLSVASTVCRHAVLPPARIRGRPARASRPSTNTGTGTPRDVPALLSAVRLPSPRGDPDCPAFHSAGREGRRRRTSRRRRRTSRRRRRRPCSRANLCAPPVRGAWNPGRNGRDSFSSAIRDIGTGTGKGTGTGMGGAPAPA